MQAIFSLAGKNRGDIHEYVFMVQRVGKRLAEEYIHGECKDHLS